MSERMTVLLAYLDALYKLHCSGLKVFAEMHDVLAELKKEIKK